MLFHNTLVNTGTVGLRGFINIVDHGWLFNNPVTLTDQLIEQDKKDRTLIGKLSHLTGKKESTGARPRPSLTIEVKR